MEVLSLNLIPTGTTPVVHVKQYDVGRTWRFNLKEGPLVYTLDGSETIECDIKKKDGNVVTVAVTNTSASYIDIETTLQMTACSGDNLGAIRLTKGSDDIGTLNFILACERSPLEGGIQSASAIHDLQAQIAAAVADQYDAADVVFDAAPTPGHGVGFAVTSEGIAAAIPQDLDDLNDVNISGQAQGEALVWDGTKWVNGTVSTVGSLDDLNDVNTTGKATGDSLRYDGNEWIAKPTTVEMTQAEYNAIVDFTPYANTHIIITDAPNLNPTASDIEYSSGVTVKQAIDNAVKIATFSFSKTINATTEATFGITRSDFNLPNNAVVVDGYIKQSNSINTNNYWAYACVTNPTSATAMQGAIYNPTNASRDYTIMATVFYTTT